VLQEDEFLQRFVGAFDDGLAPVLATLDCLTAYVDPWLAPQDFLDYLAAWVGVELDDAWTLAQRREIVAGAALVHRRRGTARGISDAVRLAVGGEVDVTESGGARWSAAPGSELPGEQVPALHVRVTVADATTIDVRRLDAVVAAVKPGHVPHTVEVVTGDVPGEE
jgi:phage tail-like protein